MMPMKLFFACFILFFSGFYSPVERPSFFLCANCFSPEAVYFAPITSLAVVDFSRTKGILGQPATGMEAICSNCGHLFYGPFGLSLNPINSRIVLCGWNARNLKTQHYRWFLNMKGN